MNKRTRYSLIAIGFTIFFILAPLIVLYVRGVEYNFTTGKFLKTGILAVRSEPKSVNILLDDKHYRSSAGDIKFLAPGEYAVTLEKEGYSPWTKRLRIYENQVTWANPVFSKVFLFLDDSPAESIATNVVDAYHNENLVYSTGKNVIVSPLDNKNQSENFALSKKTTIEITSPNGKEFIFYDKTSTTTPAVFYFTLDSKKVTDLSNLFTGPSTWKFGNDNELYALNEGQLYLIGPFTSTKTLLQKNITAFTFLGSDMYHLKQKTAGTSFLVTQNAKNEGQELLKNLELFKTADIFVTFEKQAFIIADNTLYKADSTLIPLASQVQHWDFNLQESSLIYFHSGQLDYFNPFKRNSDFITRRGTDIKNPIIRLNLGYSFFTENNTIKALELDTRGHQNEFTFYTGTDITKFSLDATGENLFIIDAGELKTLRIR